MQLDVTKATLRKAKVEVIAIGATAAPALDDEAKKAAKTPPAPTLSASADDLAEALGIDLAAELRTLRFDGSTGSVARIPTRGAVPADTLLVVGLGKPAELDAQCVRRAAAAVADATAKAASVATDLHLTTDELDTAEAAQAVVEGFLLAAYRFTAHKSTADVHQVEHLTLAGDGSKATKEAAERGRVFAEATTYARDLQNETPGNKRPPMFADRVKRDLKGTGIKVKVLDENALEKGGYGGMLAVGTGSDAPPRLVELTYEPQGATKHVALVGKGITFDSGGLSLKPPDAMITMKMDMSGAAVVLAVVRAAAQLGLKVKITGLLALAENMPSGTAQRPGDVYAARNGKTVEVLNTDAEGRLVLSDALSHASEKGPDAIVDLATLTGAVLVALGDRIAALMANDDALADALLDASRTSGEKLWRLPLPDEYREHLKSDIADIKNIGKGRLAGTIVAGLFLEEFVGEGIPWAHLDIAGLAWADGTSGYLRKGGTGEPVRTLLHWLSAA